MSSDTEGWLRHMRSAAREMLPLCAARQNARNCLSRLGLQVLSEDFMATPGQALKIIKIII
jgi:hypothetical protein